MLYDVKITGAGKLSFNSSKAELHNYPTGYFTIINATSNSNSSQQNIELTNATITFKRSPAGESESYSGFIKISGDSAFSSTVSSKQPKFILNGSIEGLIHGAFIYNKLFFYSRAQQSCIEGNFTFNVSYSTGIIYTELHDIHNIQEIKVQT
jgi:hypothetical protein